MFPSRGPVAAVLSAVLLVAAASACTPSSPGAPVVLSLWRHSGTPEELATLDRQVRVFNDRQDAVRVRVRTISEGDYNDELQSAAAARRLPDIVEVDGPMIPNYVYQDLLLPLDTLLPPATLRDQLPSAQVQGTVDGARYAVSTFDSGLGIYADRRALERAGVSWPRTVDDAWTELEFDRVLRRLAREDDDGLVLDLKRNYGLSEWLTYGFAPLVASAGGALVEPATLSPYDHLDGPAARHALSALARWRRYVDPNAGDDAFVTRRVPLSWVGHWAYPAYRDALGDDLVILPLPDLGQGPKTGQGSWAWAVSESSPHGDAAADFLGFLLGHREVLRMSDANGAVPGTRSALAASALYRERGPLRMFAEQLLRSCGTEGPRPSCVAVPRPATPGYPLLSSQFRAAVQATLEGEDPDAALDAATRAVAEDLLANDGFR